MTLILSTGDTPCQSGTLAMPGGRSRCKAFKAVDRPRPRSLELGDFVPPPAKRTKRQRVAKPVVRAPVDFTSPEIVKVLAEYGGTVMCGGTTPADKDGDPVLPDMGEGTSRPDGSIRTGSWLGGGIDWFDVNGPEQGLEVGHGPRPVAGGASVIDLAVDADLHADTDGPAVIRKPSEPAGTSPTAPFAGIQAVGLGWSSISPHRQKGLQGANQTRLTSAYKSAIIAAETERLTISASHDDHRDRGFRGRAREGLGQGMFPTIEALPLLPNEPSTGRGQVSISRAATSPRRAARISSGRVRVSISSMTPVMPARPKTHTGMMRRFSIMGIGPKPSDLAMEEMPARGIPLGGFGHRRPWWWHIPGAAQGWDINYEEAELILYRYFICCRGYFNPHDLFKHMTRGASCYHSSQDQGGKMLLYGCIGSSHGTPVPAHKKSHAREVQSQRQRAPRLLPTIKRPTLPKAKTYRDVSEVEGVFMTADYIDNKPKKRVEVRFEVRNTTRFNIMVQLNVKGFLNSGKQQAATSAHKPVLVEPDSLARLGIWKAPAAFETEWSWWEKVPPAEPRPVLVELDGVTLARTVVPPRTTDPSDQAAIMFEIENAKLFPIEVELEIEGPGVKDGASLMRKKFPAATRNIKPKVLRFGLIKATGEIDIEWSWKPT